jgi:ABC-type uncharacterized transport system substrate-binding protein
MKRREFITLLGGAAAWPLTAQAQQPGNAVIGFLGLTSQNEWGKFVAAFHRGLGETGYVEGRNLTVEYRWAEGHYDRLPAQAADLVRRKVDAIVAIAPPAALAAKAVTTTIPIVFFMGSDPVQHGLVASLNRPGGNVTGITSISDELGAKRLELLHELLPAVRMIALLVNPNNPSIAQAEAHDSEVAALQLGLKILVVNGGSANEIEQAFDIAVEQRAGAIIIRR